MKMLLAAVALAIATPAAAQTAPANPHAGHMAAPQQATTASHAGHAAQSQAGGVIDHSKMDHSQHKSCCAGGADEMTMPCEKMKAGGSKMECCEKAAGQKGAAVPNAGDNTSKQ